jgi:hypothetical protein
MIGRYCSLHDKLEASLRSGGLSSEMKMHASECQVCGAMLLSSDILQQLDELAPVAPSLSNAEALWWRSRVLLRLTQRNRREERRPSRLLALLVSVVPFLVVLSVIFWSSLDHLGNINPFVLPLLMSGAILVIAPVLGWLTLWLAEEVLRPV